MNEFFFFQTLEPGLFYFSAYLWCVYLALDEITDNLVVEVVDLGPLDALLHVLLLQRDRNTHRAQTRGPDRRGWRRRQDAETLYLLGLQRQLNEDLLQLLVHKVDAELFKSIFLQRRQHSSYHRDLVETLSSP